MNSSLSPREMSVQEEHFHECNRVELRPDLAFLYPPEFPGDAMSVANTLQSAMSYLKEVTCIDPTQELGFRVVIGYSKVCTQPNWSGKKENLIRVPWNKYLNEANEPLDVCSHELVHPFYSVSQLHRINEFWGEGFCDFLRGPLKNFMGLNGDEYWRKKIKQAKENQQDRGGNAAGQFVLRAQKEYRNVHDSDQFIEWFIDDREAIRKFVNFLFKRFSSFPMSKEFKATEWITKKEKENCKGPFMNLSG